MLTFRRRIVDACESSDSSALGIGVTILYMQSSSMREVVLKTILSIVASQLVMIRQHTERRNWRSIDVINKENFR
jgi:hypothetical protein